MPPHARKKLPVSSCFMSGGAGEWSDETSTMSPSSTALVSAAWLLASRMGGAHLNQVALSGTMVSWNVR